MARLAFYTLVIALNFLSVASNPVIIASSPNLMRVGNEETVLVSLHNRVEPVEVTVKLKLFENGDEGFISESVVTVGEDASTAVLYVDPEMIPSIGTKGELQRYAYVTVSCPELGFEETKQVLLSYENGFLFIQTDKPIYSPEQSVKIRVISLDQYLTPLSQKIQVDILTPQDVIVQRSTYEGNDIRNGIITRFFSFHQDPMFGPWKIIAYYGKDLSVNRTVEFQVQEYVVPTFSVKIQPPSFILPTDESITVRVESRYIYGKPVRGRCFMKVGVHEDGEKPIVLHSEGAMLDRHGDAEVEIETNILGEGWFEENVGSSLYVEVTVVEDATGHFENASDISAKFVRSPYMFSWKRSTRYFKKGLPYELKTDVKFMNGKPAPGVRVRVTAAATIEGHQEEMILRGAVRDPWHGDGLEPTEDDTNDKGQVNYRLYVPGHATNIRIMLETVVPELLPTEDNPIDNNARLEFNIRPFESPNENEFLVLRVPNQVIRPGYGDLLVDVFLNSMTAAPVISYFVVSRGKISMSGKRAVANVDGFEVLVTYEMVPSARIFAYYISDSGHIIADSIWIEVDRECENPLRVSPHQFQEANGFVGHRSVNTIHPQSLISLRVRGTPGTSVALLAIDKAALLLRDYRGLTLDTMYGSMDEHDAGCGPGGGRNPADVFMNAGLMVLTNLNLNVPRREGRICAVPAANNRGKRHVENQQANLRSSGIDLTDPQFITTNPLEVMLRHDFRESWAFDIVEIPEDPGTYTVDQIYAVPGSITTWSLQAFGLHAEMAMCFQNPVDLVVFKNLSIDLQMPYSVVRNEHVEVQATVYNYESYDLAVRMYLEVPDEFCSDGLMGELSAERSFIVGAHDAVTITYLLVGLETGVFPVKVAALTPETSDVVVKMLKVVPEGVPKTFQFSTILNPTGAIIDGNGQELQQDEVLECYGVLMENDGTQRNCLDINLPATAVPDSASCFVSITGSTLRPVLTSVISGLESWIRLPSGSGEQTMIHLAPNVYVLRYLTNTDSGTDADKNRALSNIQTGIIRELSFRRGDGSYSDLVSSPSSTWLTAFVGKVFCQASEFTFVDVQASCDAIEWLLTVQRSDGAFSEVSRVNNREMTVPELADSLTRATEFLEGQLDTLQRPYDVAIVTYALALANSDRRFDANSMLKSLSTHNTATGVRFWGTDASSINPGSRPYWYQQRPSVISVETTSYALLAQLILGEFSYSSPIVKWLSQQQNYGGGFVSTQDTVIALQALSEYAALNTGRNTGSNLDLSCNITAPENFEIAMRLQEGDALVRKTLQIPSRSIMGKLMITTSGVGVGQLNVEFKYHDHADDNDTECPFHLEVSSQRIDGEEGTPFSKDDKIRVRVCASYLGEAPTSMAILDVGLFSGFAPVEESLRNIVQGDSLIERTARSGRSVIFYADHIPVERDDPLCFEFEAECNIVVGNLHHAAVHVHDYYNPAEECTKLYAPVGTDLSMTLCSNDGMCVCISRHCAECSAPEYESTLDLLEIACDAAETYVFKIEVMHIQRKGGFRIITGIVELVIKRGYDELVFENSERQFWVSSSCECPRMGRGRKYMLIGRNYLPYEDEMGLPSYKYIIDNNTIVRWWRKGRRYDYLNHVQNMILSGDSKCD